jgi:hypothetical protein
LAQVSQVSRVILVTQEQLVKLVEQDHRVQQDQREIQVILAEQEQLVKQEQPE